MFPKKNRLTSSHDILLVLKKGRKITTSVCNVYILESNSGEVPRVSIVVSKKVSKSAVVRNKMKRIFRGILRPNIDALLKGARIVIVAKKEVLELEKDLVGKVLEGALLHV